MREELVDREAQLTGLSAIANAMGAQNSCAVVNTFQTMRRRQNPLVGDKRAAAVAQLIGAIQHQSDLHENMFGYQLKEVPLGKS